MTVKVKQSNRHGGKDQRRKQPDLGAKVNALPNTYKFAAEALKIMSERGGSAGSIVVGKYKSYNYKHIYAIVMNTLKNIRMVKKIIHEMKLAKRVTVDNPFLLEILVGDLLYGKGLKSIEQNTTAATILGLRDAIVKQRDILKKDKTFSQDASVSHDAKYIRINHLKTTMEHVISQLKTIGLKQVEYSKDKIKFKKFINKFKTLSNDEFMLDFHFPQDLVVLKTSGAAKLKKTDLIKKGKAMLQDKASYLAVEALNVKPSHKVIDACFAPGCKTALIATHMKNKGKIFAFDIDKKRFINALHLLKLHGANCVKTELLDFAKVKLTRLAKTNNIDSFDSIIIDPSCSGSGIQSRVDYKSSNEEAGRLKKLQSFQTLLLKHALRADVSKSIVYCTCSNSIEENEQVIEMALEESGTKTMWDIVELLPYWPHRGSSDYSFGEKCIRSDEKNLTNGFFIAKLERNQEPAVKSANSDQKPKDSSVKKSDKSTPKKKNVKHDEEDDDEQAVTSGDEAESNQDSSAENFLSADEDASDQMEEDEQESVDEDD